MVTKTYSRSSEAQKHAHWQNRCCGRPRLRRNSSDSSSLCTLRWVHTAT